jgi:diguanylate cyclase (GGDEF)-like protein/PAS domain S-box-containing protein
MTKAAPAALARTPLDPPRRAAEPSALGRVARAVARRFSPATRVATGLVSLMVMLILLVDVFTGLFPDRLDEAKRLRTASAAAVALQVNAALRQHADAGALQATIGTALRHDNRLLSLAVRVPSGELVAQIGDHARLWTLAPGELSNLQNARLPILAEGRPWADLEIAFPPATPQTLAGWLRDPLVEGISLISLLGFVVFQLYLRRVLRYLDPNSAVPERVRTAFDTLSEAVLVLDPEGNVMLVNRAFRSLRPESKDDIVGTPAARMTWLLSSLPADQELPWQVAVRENRALLGRRLHVDLPDGRRRELVMNCSPISDGAGRTRGCLASFDDVTELHERTERLRVALEELSASQREIERKNEELTIQATRDPLTGCLNRRALMQEAEQRVRAAHAGGETLSCIMCDIDHFKSINDQFGHASGDVVIQAAVKSLTRGMRLGDVLGRYGGEEFCLLLPNTSIRQALEVAERLRAEVERHVAAALRQPTRPRVTMSFGAAEWTAAVPGPVELIDFADQALYRSKQNGRNRVTAWTPTAVATEPA